MYIHRYSKLEELRTSERHYRTLLDDSSDPIFSFFKNGTYRYVNQAFASGVGKPVTSIIGRRIWDIFPKDEADKRFAVVKKVFETGKSIDLEVKVPLPNEDTYYLTTAKPVFLETGEIDSVICTSKNITARKRAEIAREEEHVQLQQAVVQIKRLSELLPICPHCKSVRDDNGDWQSLDQYITNHTDAQLSHSICVSCLKKTQPQTDEKMVPRCNINPCDDQDHENHVNIIPSDTSSE